MVSPHNDKLNFIYCQKYHNAHNIKDSDFRLCSIMRDLKPMHVMSDLLQLFGAHSCITVRRDCMYKPKHYYGCIAKEYDIFIASMKFEIGLT